MVDAAWMFGNEKRADAQLVIVEEVGAGNGQAGGAAAGSNSARARKRSRVDSSSSSGRQLVLPIHKLVVTNASEFLKTRLQSDTEPCCVLLYVPRGQLEIGRRLVRAMYEAAPNFGDLSLEERLQLLELADCYGAPKVAAAAAAAARIDDALMVNKGLAWAAVLAAYPASNSPPPPAPALRRYADDALQELFGDLEAVWAAVDDAEKRSSLLELPFAALEALLADERTRVASENTVAHTIMDWVDHHELKRDNARVKELLALVRVARLTPHYARTVFCESALARRHLSAGERAHASMLPMVGDEPSAGSRIVGAGSHWRLPARPRSALADAVVLEWSPSLAELEDLVAALPAQGEGRSSMYGPEGVVWQGWPLYLQLQSKRSASGDLMLLPGLAVELPCRTAGALIGYTLEAAAASGGGGITSRLKLRLFSAGVTSWRIPNFFRRGQAGDAAAPKDWAGVEAALRAKRLVHDDGDGDGAHLKLRCTVTQLQ